MKKLFILLATSYLMMAISFSAKASPGDSCSNPYISYMDSCNVNISLTDSITWFRLVADTNIIDILLYNPSDTLNGRVDSVILYSGSCGTLVRVATGGFLPGEDTVISMADTGLIRGTTYYIKTIKLHRGAFDNSRYFTLCTLPVMTNPHQSIILPSVPGGHMGHLRRLTASPWSDHCVSNSCGDMVSNGNFETMNATCSYYNTNSITYGMIYDWVSQNTSGFSDVSCWWGIDPTIGNFFTSCITNNSSTCTQLPYSPVTGVPDNTEGCNVTDHSTWAGPDFGYIGLSMDWITGQVKINNQNITEYSREYAIQALSNTMTPGMVYKVSFWTQLAPNSDGYINAGDMGLLFTTGAAKIGSSSWPISNQYVGNIIDVATGQAAVPQITGTCASCSVSGGTFNQANTWVNITGLYTATGNEKYIILGNFNTTSAHTTTGSYFPDGNVGYYFDDLSIVPYLTATASPSILCGASSSSTLTASSGFTNYSWSTGATGQSITVNPVSSTTYTVTASDGGSCPTYTATVTVTVDPSISVSISGSGTLCAGQSITSTVSGGSSPYTYTWAPDGETTANISTISAGVYTLTVTDALGCSTSTASTFTVDAYCCYMSCGSPLVIPSGQSSSSYTAANFTNNSCINIEGPGAFTIPAGTSFTITNCDIAMGAGASIVVVPTATLTIDNSRLYACGDMWQGIIVQGTNTSAGTLNINGTSSSSPCIVEDAIQGINMEGFVNIYYGLLNNNLYDIYVPGPGTPILSLQSSTLSCQADGSYSHNPYLKTPNLGAITNSGVYINSNNNIMVGDASSASYKNTFNNMHYGVNANNSDFSVYNNLFENMAGYSSLCMASFFYHPCPAPIGIAVLANSTNLGHTATIGGSGSNQGNTMNQCYRGVDITNYYYADVEYNTMSNTTNTVCNLCTNASPYGDHAIYIKNPGHATANNNYITNFATGIHLYGIFANESSSQASYANNNTITTTSSGTMNTGILAEDPSPIIANNGGGSYYEASYIQNNGVYNAKFACIEVNNGYKTALYGNEVEVGGNTVYIYPTAIATDGSQRTGILVQNSQGVWVDNNYVYTTGTYLSSTPCKADTSVVGIKGFVSNNVVYTCNHMYDVGQCMKFLGNCNPSTLNNNQLEYSFDGLVLESNASLGDQLSNNYGPAGNTWQSLSSFLRSETYAFNSKANYSSMWVLNNSLELPTNNQYSPLNYSKAIPYFIGPITIGSPPAISIYTITGTDISCPAIGGSGGAYTVYSWLYRPLAAKMVQDSMLYPIFVSECEYMDKQTVFAQIKEDTNLMDSSTVLHTFYHVTSGSMSGNNIGKLYVVDSDIAQGNYLGAESVNNSLTPVNKIETNQRLVNYVYLHTLAAGVDTPTVSEYDTLMNIASQCPFEGGRSVFLARALLNGLWNANLVFIDSCNVDTSVHAPEKRITNTQNIQIGNMRAKVYPNPANTMLNIQVSLQAGQTAYFEMYNNLGQQVENKKLNSQLTTLPVNNLSSGIYYYRITNQDGSILKADKQLLMH